MESKFEKGRSLDGVPEIGSLPVLGDFERPLELEVRDVVIVHKLGDGVVMSSGDHTRRSLLLVD